MRIWNCWAADRDTGQPVELVFRRHAEGQQHAGQIDGPFQHHEMARTPILLKLSQRALPKP